MDTQGQSPENRERVAREAELRALASGTGQKIGRFVIQEMLGDGGFGAVYRAIDPDLAREVAIKVPRGLTDATKKEFLREARAAATIEHANVCPVYEVSPDGTTIPYIVSRFVRGGTLSKLIEKNPNGLPAEAALGIALKIAKGVAAAHARGIVHRDLKPANVLYDAENEEFLITDFGMAKLLVHASQSSGGTKGTPAYMSPEQFGDGEKAGDVSPHSDVYALGVILYELLTGKPPFHGLAPLQLMFAHVQTKPTSLSARRRDLGTKYDDLCLKALKKAPSERHASAKAFVDALGAALRVSSVVQPPRKSWWQRLWDPDGSSPPAPTPKQFSAQAAADCQLGHNYYFGRGVGKDYAKAREWYERAAAQGNATAQINLGTLFANGHGVTRDYAKAREWYEKAAAQNSADAQFGLGVLYHNGYGVEQDYVKAREWYERAAAQNHATGQVSLGLLLRQGLGGTRDDAKAREWYEKSAAQGNVIAQYNLGVLYEKGHGVARDYVKAREWYEKAAAQNSADAQFGLGVLYHNGYGVLKDYAKAREWYEKAAIQNDAQSQAHLGTLYQNGLGGAQDYAKAREWYEKAAAQNNAFGQVGLGILYKNGWGGVQDYVKAREWYEKAVAQNNAQAQSHFGTLYKNGWGVPQDYKKAREWYEKAAAQNYAPAQVNLGVLYESGQGVLCDYAKARVWYEKAAAQGNATAQANLGILYQNGYGVPKDYAKAREWYEKAAKQGHEQARRKLKAMEGVESRRGEKVGLGSLTATELGRADTLFSLGVLNENGTLPYGINRAIELYRLAAKQGHKDAKDALKRLKQPE